MNDEEESRVIDAKKRFRFELCDFSKNNFIAKRDFCYQMTSSMINCIKQNLINNFSTNPFLSDIKFSVIKNPSTASPCVANAKQTERETVAVVGVKTNR